ncbi:MAG: DUF2630 family protein [Chloroflexi bacterium]|nr:DUF2630 family protein [Chloroflexota bacterium]
MSQPTQDADIYQRINDLSREEEQLWSSASDGSGLDTEERARIDAIKVELDQAYDLLRQRQALRAAGRDPSEAVVRPADVVERYQQ